MRQLFIADASILSSAEREGQTCADDIDGARDAAPWACVVVPVDGGWRAFESRADAETWEQQA